MQSEFRIPLDILEVVFDPAYNARARDSFDPALIARAWNSFDWLRMCVCGTDWFN